MATEQLSHSGLPGELAILLKKETPESKNPDRMLLENMGEIDISIPNIQPSDYAGETDLFEPDLSPEDTTADIKASVAQVDCLTPDGRKMNLRRQEVLIYSSILAGKSEEEIIRDEFHGKQHLYYSNFSSLTYELGIKGFSLSPTNRPANGQFYGLESKKPTYKTVTETIAEIRIDDYISLSDKDIEIIAGFWEIDTDIIPVDFSIFNYILEKTFNNATRAIALEDLFDIVDPENQVGDASKIDYIRQRVDRLNSFLKKHGVEITHPRIADSKGEFLDENQIFINFPQMASEKTIREELLENVTGDFTPIKKVNFSLEKTVSSSKQLVRTQLVRQDGKKTLPILFTTKVVEDKKQDGTPLLNEKEKPYIFVYHALPQFRILELLFQQGNVPATFIHSMLKSNSGEGSDTRKELQTYIKEVDEKLRRWGMCIEVQWVQIGGKANHETLTLAKFIPDKYTPLVISNAIVDLKAEEEALPNRQRRRQPSYGKIHL